MGAIEVNQNKVGLFPARVPGLNRQPASKEGSGGVGMSVD